MQHTSMVTHGVEIDFQRWWPDQHPAPNFVDTRQAVEGSFHNREQERKKGALLWIAQDEAYTVSLNCTAAYVILLVMVHG